MKRGFLTLLIAAFAVLLAACGSVAAPGGAPAPLADASKPTQRDFAETAGEAAQGQPGGAQTVPIGANTDPDRAIVRTASVALRSRDAWSASDRLQELASGLGGEVASLSQSGARSERSAAVTLRVPSTRFTEALRRIRDLSDVEVVSSSVDSKDVTDQFVDLQARLRAKEAEEQRYLALLGRAERIEDILRIDQALAAVRMQIEQLTAQINSIRSRTEFSTIAVSIAPLVAGAPGAYDPARTAERALAALLVVLRFFGDALIWTLVFGWMPLLVAAGAFLTLRLRTRPAAS
jgi:hypothetical protein